VYSRLVVTVRDTAESIKDQSLRTCILTQPGTGTKGAMLVWHNLIAFQKRSSLSGLYGGYARCCCCENIEDTKGGCFARASNCGWPGRSNGLKAFVLLNDRD